MNKKLLLLPLFATFVGTTSCSSGFFYKVNVVSKTLIFSAESFYKGEDFFAYVIVPDGQSPEGKTYVPPARLAKVSTGDKELDIDKGEYLYHKQTDGNCYISISRTVVIGDITIEGEADTI